MTTEVRTIAIHEAAKGSSKLVPAAFPSREQAEAAIEDLRKLGLSNAEIGIALPDPEHHDLLEDRVGAEEIKGAVRGGIIGAPIGSLAGIAILALAAGGIGALGLGGVLLAAEVGIGWGVFVGAEVGLTAKVHQEEEQSHDIPLDENDILVLATAGEQTHAAHDIMLRHGGRCYCAIDQAG